jgi:serine/threonine protein kinase
MAGDLKPLAPGQNLGRYTLDEWLGEGGFAEVWRAHASGAKQMPLAIKVVRRSYLNDESVREMFLDEARLAARAHHPNIAKVWEIGEDGGHLFLVMELVDGGSLSGLCEAYNKRNQLLPPAVALKVMCDLAIGLHEAHELRDENNKLYGIVHRDVTPQNVLLTRTGIAKLVDFGIAHGSHRSASYTRTGATKGKAPYMSPEQVRADKLDRRTDIWALGIVTYELLTGITPFSDPLEHIVMQRIAANQPVPDMGSHVPKAVAKVVMKALHFQPGKRHASAKAFADELQKAMNLCGLHATEESVRSCFGIFEAPMPDRNAKTVERRALSTVSASALATGSSPARRSSLRPLLATAGGLALAGALAGGGLFWRMQQQSKVGSTLTTPSQVESKQGAARADAVSENAVVRSARPTTGNVAPSGSSSAQSETNAAATSQVASAAVSTAKAVELEAVGEKAALPKTSPVGNYAGTKTSPPKGSAKLEAKPEVKPEVKPEPPAKAEPKPAATVDTRIE